MSNMTNADFNLLVDRITKLQNKLTYSNTKIEILERCLLKLVERDLSELSDVIATRENRKEFLKLLSTDLTTAPTVY